MRHEINFCCPEADDDPQIHHHVVASWDVAEATALAPTLGVACYGFRFTSWEDGSDPTSSADPVEVSPFYLFGGVVLKTAAELRESAESFERAQGDAAGRDGMRRAVLPANFVIAFRDTDVILPPL